MLIIDSHCHAGKGDGFTGPWNTAAPLKDYLRWADEYRITRTNLFPVFNSDYEKSNHEVAKIVYSNPSRFYGFAMVHPSRDRGRVFCLVSKAVRQYNFLGIKVHLHDARITREVCEAARHFSLPVLYDIMGEISQVYLVAAEYPDVNFIIPHLGSFTDDWVAQKSFIDPLSRFGNIFTDSSGVRRFEILKESFERAGAQKILFGSDGPWLHPGVELEKIFALKAHPDELKLILAGNFLRLTGKQTEARFRPNADLIHSI